MLKYTLLLNYPFFQDERKKITLELMIEKVIMFAIIIAISFAGAKAGWLGEAVRMGLSRFIIKITAPLMIFTSIAGLQFDPALVRESVTIVIISIIAVSVLLMLGALYVKLARLDKKTRGVQVALMSFGNVAFIAYPLLEAVFGPMGVFYGAFYHLINDIGFWSIGVAKIDYKGKKTKKERILSIFSSNFLAIVFGLIFFSLQIKIPSFIFDTMKGLGGTTVYLSLSFIGVAMSEVDIRKTYKKLSIYVIVLVKMIIVPVIAAFVLTRVHSFGLSYEAVCAAVLQISMPCMTLVSIMANEVDGNYRYAAEAVFASTIASLFVMPAVLYIIDYFIKI